MDIQQEESKADGLADTAQKRSVLCLFMVGWAALPGSHPAMKRHSAEYRFFGQASVRLDCPLCFRCLPSGQRGQSSGTEGDKQSGRLCRHRTSKDLTAFRGGGRGLHPLLTLRPLGRCGGDGCSSGWTFSKKRAKRTA